jgi:hypothetical protein
LTGVIAIRSAVIKAAILVALINLRLLMKGSLVSALFSFVEFIEILDVMPHIINLKCVTRTCLTQDWRIFEIAVLNKYSLS